MDILKDSFELTKELKCTRCGSLQTYHLKKTDSMRCRRCGNIFIKVPV